MSRSKASQGTRFYGAGANETCEVTKNNTVLALTASVIRLNGYVHGREVRAHLLQLGDGKAQELYGRVGVLVDMRRSDLKYEDPAVSDGS